MQKRFWLFALLSLLIACTESNPLPTNGFWRSTEIQDPNPFTHSPDTTNLYEFNFGTSSVTGWRYGCDAQWTACAPKGYGLALSGSLANFEFSYKPLTDGTVVKVRITGAFTSGGFNGRFEKTANTGAYSTVKGNITLTWVQSQR